MKKLLTLHLNNIKFTQKVLWQCMIYFNEIFVTIQCNAANSTLKENDVTFSIKTPLSTATRSEEVHYNFGHKVWKLVENE